LYVLNKAFVVHVPEMWNTSYAVLLRGNSYTNFDAVRPVVCRNYKSNPTYFVWQNLCLLLFSQTPHIAIKPIITEA
jgi:hypothetical protein